MADARVSSIVERYLPSRARMNRALHACHYGAGHIAQPSYGQTKRHTVGLVYEICTNKGRNKCGYHGSQLAEQMSPRESRHCFEELANLQPAGYGDEDFTQFCALQIHDSRQDRPAPATGAASHGGALRILFPSTPTSQRARGAPQPLSTRSALGNTPRTAQGRSVGRPVKTRQDVNLYVFLRDGQAPIRIVAEGLVDDGVLSFRLGQEAVKRALATHGDGGKRVRLEMWSNASGGSFVKCPRNDTQILLPGEGRLYRKVGVLNLLDFNLYKFLVLPDVSRRLPSLATYAAEHSRAGPSNGHATRVAADPQSLKRPRSPLATPRKKARASAAEHSQARYAAPGRQWQVDEVIDLTLSDPEDGLGGCSGTQHDDIIELSDTE